MKSLLAIALILSTVVFIPRSTRACGPFFTDAIFVFTKHPDFPLERFAQGQLGVLQPSYARSYLFVAYRNLIDAPLSPKEVEAMKSLWEDRLNYSGEVRDDQWIKKWTDARTKVPGLAAVKDLSAFRHRDKPHEYEAYLNCQQDAFENAAHTLNERIRTLGAENVGIRSWVAAQDLVFANCSEGRHIPVDPAAETPDLPPILRADRAYQIAAANFYATDFDEAARRFDAIAQDTDSPWRTSASYLAARAMLRKGSFAEKEERSAPLIDAETRLNAVINDKSLRSFHAAAQRLLNLTRLRLRPEEKLHELARSIIKPNANADFKQDVWDYTALLDKFVGDDEDAKKTSVPESLKSDDVNDWILTFQAASAEAATRAHDRWDKTHALPWLVVVLANSNGQSPGLDSLLSAAARIDHSSPAFASVAFHRVRLLAESKRVNDARSILDQIIAADRGRLPASAVNQLLTERTRLSQNLEEFLTNAQRAPAGFSDDSDGRQIPEDDKDAASTTKGAKLFFDLDAANIFNRAMPVAIMTDAARSTTLADNLRRDVAQAAFSRAALLDEHESAGAAARRLADVYPETRNFLTTYQTATTPDARRFAAAYLSLKFPGLRPYVVAGVGRTTELKEIDSYRDNYWCAEPPVAMSGAAWQGDDEDKSKAPPIVPPEFLKSSQAVAAGQLAALQALGTAPNYFCRIAIDWAEKNPNEARSPEALHLAVRSTRYGCTDKETGRWSKAAFDLLRRRYPNTTWAKATKYWFKG